MGCNLASTKSDISAIANPPTALSTRLGLFLLVIHFAPVTASSAEKSPPFVGTSTENIASPWKAGCDRYFQECHLSNLDAKRTVMKVSPLTRDASSPDPHVLVVVVDRPYTVQRPKVGEIAVEYLGVRLTPFKETSCRPYVSSRYSYSAIGGPDTCWELSYRIPDRYPTRAFSIALNGFPAKPSGSQAVIYAPSVSFQFSVDTAPPIGAVVDAVRNGDAAKVKRLIAAGGSIYDVKMFGPDARVDRTPMLIAAALGKTDVVRVLLEAGYDVNWQPEQIKSSLLIEAIRNQAPAEIIRILLEAGARTDSLYWANGVAYTAVNMAIGHPDYAVVIPMLVAHGADINYVNDFGSVLWSARNGNTPYSAIHVLEQSGARLLPPVLRCPSGSTLRQTVTAAGFGQRCERKSSAGDIAHGGDIFYGPDGRTQSYATYENGVLTQKESFRPDGKRLLSEGYHANAGLKYRMHYRENGSPLRSDVYSESGELLRSLFYERGFDVSRTVHYKDGKEVPEQR